MDESTLLCLDSVPTVLGLFDFSIAPPLLFYSYVPAAITALLLVAFLFTKRKTPPTIYLGAMMAAFALWLLNDIIQWAAVYNAHILFAWQLNILLETVIFTSALGFVLLHDKKKIKMMTLGLLSIPVVAAAVIVPTSLNIVSYDIVNCEGIQGVASSIQTMYEVVVIAVLLIICVSRFIRRKRVEAVLSLMVALMLGMFFAADLFGTLTEYYYSPVYAIGLVAFSAGLTYYMTRFSLFNIKVFTSKILVIAIWIALLSLLFVREIEYVRIAVAITLILYTFIGYAFAKSIDRDTMRLEQIRLLATDLEKINNQQANLLHFVTHQVKGFFTKSRNIFATALEGEFGDAPELLKRALQEGKFSDEKGIAMVQELLNATNIQRGTVQFDMKLVDIGKLVQETEKDLMMAAGAKGIELTMDMPLEKYFVNGDALYLRQAIRNVIDNAIRYTPQGSVRVVAKEEASCLVIEVIDTGVGISPQDMPKLFTEGGRGSDSRKVNVDSTGYGLYIVKNVVEAHKGSVSVKSDGTDKGSVFTITLPLAQKPTN